MKAAFAVLALLLVAATAQALIMVGRGNDPIADHNWPAGSLELANLKIRVGWWEGPPFGGGQYCFEYRGDTKAFQEALDLFAKIKAPHLKLVLHEGPQESPFLRDPKDPKANARYDWSFTVWNPENWNHLYNNPNSTFMADDPSDAFRKTVAPPQLDVYLAADGKGVDWKQVKVPANVTVSSELATTAGYQEADGSVLRGDLFDMSTSKPITGAKVAVQKLDQNQYGEAMAATSDASGHFELKQVPAGNYRIVASADGYAPRMLGYMVFGQHTLKQLESQLVAPATVTGTAVGNDGKPLAGITVRADNLMATNGRGYLVPDRIQVVTDDQGRFELAGLPTGHLVIFAYDKTHAMLEPLKRFDAPAKDLVVLMTATGIIKGQVLHNGAPAKDAQVGVHAAGGSRVGTWGGSMNANPDGTFQFDAVPPGRYVVSANPGLAIDNRDADAQTIEVKPNETTQVELTK